MSSERSSLVPVVFIPSQSIKVIIIFFQWLDSPLGAKAAAIFEASRSHFLDTPQSVGLLWTSDQLVAKTST
jgi:hypothetical protein